MILEKKKYMQKEIAQWLQISPQTMSTNKKKYLDLLKNYAKYHFEGKSIVIDEVYEETYTKVSAMDRRIQTIDKEGGIKKYLPHGNDYTTLRDMAMEYMDNHLEEKKENPVLKAFSLVAKRDYGKFPKGEGPVGTRRLCWVKVVNYEYIQLTIEEWKLVNKLYNKHFSPEFTIGCIEAYSQGELTGDELGEKMVGSYTAFMADANREIGAPVKTVTLFTVNGLAKD